MDEPKKTKSKADLAPRYPVEELIPHSEQLFGCKPEVLRGALHGAQKTEYTVDEIKQLIDKFQKRKVN